MVLVNNEDVNSSTDDEGAVANQAENEYRRSQQQQYNTPESNSSTDDDKTEILKILIGTSKKICHKIKQISNFIMVDLGGYQVFDRSVHWCVQHPHLAICLLAAGLVASLPLLLFVAFVLSTILMTFTGFLVLEGTVLTIITMMVIGVLGALALVFLTFAVVGVATYFGVAHVYDIYSGMETTRTDLRNDTQSNDLNINPRSALNRISNQTSRHENVND